VIGLPERHLEEPGIGDVFPPLICVLLVLVVFLVLQLSWSSTQGGGLEAATAAGLPAADRAIRINVTGAGTIHLDGRRVELSSIHAALSQARFTSPSFAVAVGAEPSAHFSLVLAVLEACRSSGAADVRFTLTRDTNDHDEESKHGT